MLGVKSFVGVLSVEILGVKSFVGVLGVFCWGLRY